MLQTLRQNLSLLLILLVTPCCLAPGPAVAGDHIVSPADMRAELVGAVQARQANLDKVRSFFSTETAARALSLAAVDASRVEHAIPLLSDEELARLAALTDKTRVDFKGGSLTNQQLTYIVIALATAVVILVIVEK